MKMLPCAPLLVTFVASCTMLGQSATLQDSDAIMLKVCEQGDNSCGLWTFLKGGWNAGIGEWSGGEVASISYTFDSKTNTFVFRRADTRGPFAGQRVIYTGTLDKDGLSGSFVKTQSGHSDSQSGHWFASAAPPVPIPEVIHFCGANCFTLAWRDGHFINPFAVKNPNGNGIWTVEKFTRFSVVLHRHDPYDPSNPRSTPSGWNVTYRAQLSVDGENLINVTEDTPTGDRWPNPGIRAAWGSHIKDVPGSNQERDALHWQPTTAPPCDVKCVIGWADDVVTTLEILNRFAKLSSPNN